MLQDTQYTAMSNTVRVVVHVVLPTLACGVYTTVACVCCCVCCVCVVVQLDFAGLEHSESLVFMSSMAH